MITHISYSMMSLFDTCRECFKYKYIMGLKGEIPDYYEEGREYHDEVDAYHTGRQYNEALIKAYTRVFSPDYRKQSEVWLEDLNKGQPVFVPGVKLPIKGKIDGINEAGLCDLKFTKSRISQRQADESEQATLYIWVYFTLTGKNVPFFFNVVDKQTGRVGMVKTSREPARFDGLAHTINEFIKEVERGDFTALPGQKCFGQCEFYNICETCSGQGKKN
jgi:hypothetical protein